MNLSLKPSQAAVAAIFMAYFQRAPEFNAMQHYVGVLQGFIAHSRTADQAFYWLSAQIYHDGLAAKELPQGPAVTHTWYVNHLYANTLGRAADSVGLEYWAAELEKGNLDRATLAAAFIEAALSHGGRDQAYVQNRTAVAVEFSQWENSNALILPQLKYNAAQILLGVNEDPASVVAAQARLHSQNHAGDTFYLTLGIDTLQGGVANDVFNAVYEGSQEFSTLTAFDSLDGGLGTDILNIYLGTSSTPYHFPDSASVRNIEIVNLYNGAATAGNDDPSHWDASNTQWLSHLGNYSGIQEFWQWGSAAPVLEVPAGVLVGFRNVDRLWTDIFLHPEAHDAHIRFDHVTWQQHPDAAADEGRPWLYVSGEALEAVTLDGTMAPDANLLWLDVVGGAGVRSLKVDIAVDTLLSVMPWERPADRLVQLDASASQGNLQIYADPLTWASLAEGWTVLLGSGNDRLSFDQRGGGKEQNIESQVQALPEDGFLWSEGAELDLPSDIDEIGRALGLRDELDGGAGYDTLELWVQGRIQTQTYDAIARARHFEEITFVTTSDAILDSAQLHGFETLSVSGVGLASTMSFTVWHHAAERTLAVDMTPNLRSMVPTSPWARIDLLLEDAEQDLNLELRHADVHLAVGSELGASKGSLQVQGQGVLEFNNHAGKFAELDTQEMTGSLLLTGMATHVAETVVLAAGPEHGDSVAVTLLPTLGAASSSTLALTDTIVGWHEQATLKVGVAQGSEQAAVYQASFQTQDTLQASLAAAAVQFAGQGSAAPLAAHDLVAFVFEGDTYLYGDTVATGQGSYDGSDFLLRLAGWTDLDLLVAQAVEFVPLA